VQLHTRNVTGAVSSVSSAGTPITAKTVEAQTGLSYRTISRNTEAYALFSKHAAYFQPRWPCRPKAGTSKRAKPKAAAWDPLLGRPTRQLAQQQRVEAANGQQACPSGVQLCLT
jgi:hypothetical protein